MTAALRARSLRCAGFERAKIRAVDRERKPESTDSSNPPAGVAILCGPSSHCTSIPWNTGLDATHERLRRAFGHGRATNVGVADEVATDHDPARNTIPFMESNTRIPGGLPRHLQDQPLVIGPEFVGCDHRPRPDLWH